MFKKKQKYRNIFMSIGFNYEGRSYSKCGTAIGKYPSNLDVLQSVANELAHNFNTSIK